MDPECYFSHDQFQHFVDWVEFKFDKLLVVWYVEPTTQMDYVVFCFKEQFYILHKTNKCTGVVSMVTKENWVIVCQDVKNQCTFTRKGLIFELDRRFLAHELMNANGIVYLQHWVQLEVILMFLTHLQILKLHYCYWRLTEPNAKSDACLLDHVIVMTFFILHIKIL